LNCFLTRLVSVIGFLLHLGDNLYYNAGHAKRKGLLPLRNCAERYFDMEWLAMVGMLFADHLKKATTRKFDLMILSRKKMESALRKWHKAWADHDLDGVMELFHEEVLFENWTGGKAEGRENLRRAWSDWFTRHCEFRFIEEETFIDESLQKVLYRWQLSWGLSSASGC
jgi:hypothetical protein